MHHPADLPEWRTNFGARLQQLRTEAGLSQEQLANAAGLDRTYVGGVERGRRNPTLVTMWRLAGVLDVDPSAFFTDEAGPDAR